MGRRVVAEERGDVDVVRGEVFEVEGPEVEACDVLVRLQWFCLLGLISNVPRTRRVAMR